MLIYCVEDDDNIRELVLYTLRASGYQAEGFPEGKSFLLALEERLPQLILLDIMLPAVDGLTLLKRIRSRGDTQKIPVILLTAKSAEVDKVIGLDSGADDYMTKPFGMMELLSRIRAVLRRTNVSLVDENKSPIEHYEITVDLSRHRVFSQTEELDLTLKEFDLLVYLLQNKGLALSRGQILQGVWGYDAVGETRTVDVHIQTLRQKLGAEGQRIETVRGVGYRMEA